MSVVLGAALAFGRYATEVASLSSPNRTNSTVNWPRSHRCSTDCEVLHQDFLALDLPPARFDGGFANTSLFHVPSSQLARVFRDLATTLKPYGVPFCSNPRGHCAHRSGEPS